ncbi:MAG: SDR family NAD(P)-dependent oxidoreductase [Sulfitobacter sp.]
MNILLIGASSELGRQIHTTLEARGHTVLGSYNANASRDDLLPLDVRSEDEMAEFIKAAIEKLGKIDGVIFCSAIDHPELVKMAKLDKWQDVMDVNYFGAVRLAKHLLPHFLKNDGGIFEFISSGMATRSNIGTAAYAASKAALNALSMGISKEHGKNGVVSFTIMPGFFEGGLIKDMDASKKSRIATIVDSKRIADPREIAEFTVGALENSSYLNASNLEINGGLA